MGEIIMRNWDIREDRVRVNLPSPIRQVRVLIWGVITPIQGVPNPMRQVVPMISHIHSYPPPHSHLHPPSLSFLSITLPSTHHTKLSYPSLSLHAMIMSWHRVQHIPKVQHTPDTASTQDCLSSLHSHDYEVTPECSLRLHRGSLYNRPPSAICPWEPKGKVTLWHLHGCEL